MGSSYGIIVLLVVHVWFANSSSLRTHDNFIAELFERVSNEQVLKDQPYRAMISWQKNKGVYPSHVLQNFHGTYLSAEARKFVQVFDNNMFVTTFVTISLLEAFKYGLAPRPSDQQLVLSINALKDYQDKNQPYNTSVMSFWQQQFNQTTNHWEARPVNLFEVFHLLDHMPLTFIEDLLKVVGLGWVADFIKILVELKNIFHGRFHIPPDFDDTFANLALGSLLYQQKLEFPDAWSQWRLHNTNITSIFDSLKKYAYRPFSADPNLNSIDPRAYFHIRGFLDQAWENREDIALVPTWAQTIDEERVDFYKGVAMPFEINNIDVTVAANTIYGITSAVLSGLISPTVLSDPIIEQIYHNTSSLIAFEIKNNFSGRPDLALTYYPSRIEFYWLVARTATILESARRSGTLPLKIMDTVYTIFTDVVEGYMTKDILHLAKRDGPGSVYFDDFIGNDDFTLSDRPLIRGEDRIFTTAMAANALMSSWTYHDTRTGTSHWKTETPWSVKKTVAGCVKWLRRYTLSGKYKPWNAFFSGSAKGFKSLPFWYPGNRLEYLNGTSISNWTHIPNATVIYAVQGYVPADRYNDMLNKTHFGYYTPMTFGGYNNGSGSFPFWSSVPYTYSTTLLAVSRFGSVV